MDVKTVSVVVVLVALSLAACAPMDRWTVFENAVDRDLARMQDRDQALAANVTPAGELPTEPVIPTDGSPLVLSVEQAVGLALRGNRDLAVEQLGPMIAGTFEAIERGRFDPELFARLQYNQETARETARATGGQFDVDARDADSALGVRQTLPTGTTVELSAENRYTASNRAPEQYESRLGLSVTQSLLRGFGPAVNLVAVRQAKLDAVASLHELRGFTEALLADSEIAYWQLVLARREISIFEKSLAVARQQLGEIEERIKVGVLAPTEAAAARAEVARREQALIDARSTQEARRLRLVRLINASATGDLLLPLDPTSTPGIDPQPVTDLAERIQLALRQRPDLREAELRLEQDRLETIVTRNGLLPRLELFIDLGKTGFGKSFTESLREMDGQTYDFTVGVSLTQSLSQRTEKARDLRARLNRQQSARAVANLKQIVQLEVRLAANTLEQARQQIAASATTLRLEEQTAHAEEERYDVGVSTSLLLAQAQRDLLEAQIAEVRAVVNYRIALVNLYLAEGSLLDRRGIRIADSE